MKHLLKTSAFIGGEWVNTPNKFEVNNPSTGKRIAMVADCGEDETQKAIEKASEALPGWSSQTAKERSDILRRWYELMMENRDDLGLILTLEQGKPLEEAKGEIAYGAAFIEWFSEEARRVYGDTIPGHQSDKRIITLRQPIGVCAAITPWNFPNAMIARKAGPALAAGCTMVVKPAESTPLSALAMAYLAEKAGLPPGVLSILPASDPSKVGGVLTSHPLVRKLSFTGSTSVGKELMRQSASTVKKLSLELGGNAPFIVFDDADIDRAVDGAIASKYRNAGQTCVCANRIFVQREVAKEFTEKLIKATNSLKVGDGQKEGVDIGPLINTKAITSIDGLIRDAEEKGAIIHRSHEGEELSGNFYPPTVIENATSSMKLHGVEIFGPVSPVYQFDTEEEVIQMANDTPYGLACYFYGSDHSRIWRVAEALEYGIVGINTGIISTAVAPFGGVKESGFGREGSRYGIEEYTELKYICWDIG